MYVVIEAKSDGKIVAVNLFGTKDKAVDFAFKLAGSGSLPPKIKSYIKSVIDEIDEEESEYVYTKSAQHAPKGGVTINGKEFVGGQFIPSEDLNNATDDEINKLNKKKEIASRDDEKSPYRKKLLYDVQIALEDNSISLDNADPKKVAAIIKEKYQDLDNKDLIEYVDRAIARLEVESSKRAKAAPLKKVDDSNEPTEKMYHTSNVIIDELRPRSHLTPNANISHIFGSEKPGEVHYIHEFEASHDRPATYVGKDGREYIDTTSENYGNVARSAISKNEEHEWKNYQTTKVIKPSKIWEIPAGQKFDGDFSKLKRIKSVGGEHKYEFTTSCI